MRAIPVAQLRRGDRFELDIMGHSGDKPKAIRRAYKVNFAVPYYGGGLNDVFRNKVVVETTVGTLLVFPLLESV